MNGLGFNPEEVAGYKIEVSADLLYRWALAMSSACGTIQGVQEAFAKKGLPIDMLSEEATALEEVRLEIVKLMRQTKRRIA